MRYMVTVTYGGRTCTLVRTESGGKALRIFHYANVRAILHRKRKVPGAPPIPELWQQVSESDVRADGVPDKLLNRLTSIVR